MNPKWLLFFLIFSIADTHAKSLVYEGEGGIGSGKHIVFIANDHEYRSEQTCPLMAKILAKHFGFRCTVLFGVSHAGTILPGAKNVPGMDALKSADLLFFFTRFMNLPDDQVDHLVNYFERGGPVVGLRTSTHCFNGQEGKWAKLNYNYTGQDYMGGLGEQVFGNTWHKQRGQSHYGSNHTMGSRITPIAEARNHPILSGVHQIHAYSGAYKSTPPEGATPLLEVQVLNTFHPSDDINKDKPLVNAGWARSSYVAPSGDRKQARVVYTSLGASEDLLSEDARRFLLNACLWAGGWEAAIRRDLDTSIVGTFKPSTYTSGLYLSGIHPTDLSGWESQIMPSKGKLEGLDSPKFKRRQERILQHRPHLRLQIKEAH